MDPRQSDAVFGHWLKHRRRVLDLTQKQLARRARCSVATIRKLERDERRPSRGMAKALAAALDVPDDEHQAFIQFARAGWSDAPPAPGAADVERPWLPQPRAKALPAPTGTQPAVHGDLPDPARVELRPSSPPSLYGRERELGRLHRVQAQVLAGHGQVVVVVGDAGSGKSALLTAFAAQALGANRDLVAAWGACNAFVGGGDPFLPFRQLLTQLVGDAAGSSQRTAVPGMEARLLGLRSSAAQILQRRAPRTSAMLISMAAGANAGAVHPAGLDLLAASAASRPAMAALCAETATALVAIATEAPLLLLLDDLQWIDDGSLDLLLQLARKLAGARILLVCAYRRTGSEAAEQSRSRIDSAVHELERLFGDTVLDLERADGRSFLDGWLDREPNVLGVEFREALLRQTAGQPLFTIELLRAMQERGDLQRDDRGRWATSATLSWGTLPRRVAGVLAERMAPLGSLERRVLDVGSVEGETFTAEVVARVLREDPVAIVQAADEVLASRHRLLVEQGVSRAATGLATRFRFVHGLVQMYLYDNLGEGQRSYLHQAIAEALEDVHGDAADPVALALHFTLARSPARAVPHHRRAAERARDAGAFDAAADHYRAALEHWPTDEEDERLAMEQALGECLWLAGHYRDVLDVLESAREGFLARGNHAAATRSQLFLARALYDLTGEVRPCVEAARRAVEMARADGPSETPELAFALSSAAFFEFMAEGQRVASTWHERALEVAQRVGATTVEIQELDRFGALLAHFQPQRREEGLGMLARAERMRTEGHGPGWLGSASYNLADALRGLGRNREAMAMYDRFIEESLTPERTFDLHTRVERWRLAWDLGEWAWALARYHDMKQALEGSADLHRTRAANGIAAVELDLGLPNVAHATLAPHARRDFQDVVVPVRVALLRERLRLAVALGDGAAADTHASAILDAMAEEPEHFYDVLVPALDAVQWLAARPHVGTPERLEIGTRALAQTKAQYGSAEAQAAASQAAGALARSADLHDRAADHLLEAGNRWRDAGFPLAEARALCAAAFSLDATGNRRARDTARTRADALLSALASQISDDEAKRSFTRVRRTMLGMVGTGASELPLL